MRRRRVAKRIRTSARTSRLGPDVGRQMRQSTKRQRVKRIVKRGKPVPARSEDSLPPAVAKGLSKHGWEYRGGAWRPGRGRYWKGAPIRRADRSLGPGSRWDRGSRNPGWKGRSQQTERAKEPRLA